MPDSSLVMDTDPLLGRVRLFHDLGDERWAIESRYDLEPVLEANQLARDQWPGHYRGTPDLGITLAAHLPMPIWTDLRQQGLLQDPEIGRASCRERVESSVVGGAMKKRV